jgi:catechol 2,3-dioxygenase-like lactoylglutathione lyase family enzyme
LFLSKRREALMTEAEDILLDVADPEASARFYAGLLAIRPLESGPDHALFLLGSGRALSLWRRSRDRPDGLDVREVTFRMDGRTAVDETHMDWWDRGARIVLPPMDLACGRSFVARDPDGHRLRVYAEA